MTGQWGSPHVAGCRKKAPHVPDPSKVRLALYQPDIPQNLGAILRLAACFDVAVDLIEPCGFPLTDKALRRTAMDYGAAVGIRRHDGWSAFLESHSSAGRLVLFSTKGMTSLETFAFEPADCLLFGRESAGVPDEVHAAADAVVRLPMTAGMRSMNVAMTAGVAVWEALKQTGALPGRS
ncbi:MAG TPA: tRNA (cytidine(34)-2'-O)-methyltransferase [Hyphomonadaceae bacterium]|nr:tRNA (cytidine(34)-2'-O)-methyltransferase [Hyphomonadaceae bacterium]